MAQKKESRRAKGDGTVFATKDGRYKAQLTVGYKKDGSPRKITRTVGTKSEAYAVLQQLRVEHSTGKLSAEGDITLQEFAPRWKQGKKVSVKPKTFMDYDSILKNVLLPSFGRIALEKLTTSHINKFITEMLEAGIRPSSVTKYRAILSSIMKAAVVDGIISRNPVEYSIPVRQEPSSRDAIPSEALDKIFNEAHRISSESANHGHRAGQSFVAYAVLKTAYYTGMRIGEIFALRWEHIDLTKRTIRICENIVEAKDTNGKHGIIVGSPKTKRSNRTIKVSQKLCEILKDMRPAIAGDTDIVFQSSAGGYIAPSNFARVWRRILRNIGMAGQYEMYEFRHTHATLLLATGRFSMASVQKRLGHESPQTTLKHYAHAIAAEDELMADAFDSEEY